MLSSTARLLSSVGEGEHGTPCSLHDLIKMKIFVSFIISSKSTVCTMPLR